MWALLLLLMATIASAQTLQATLVTPTGSEYVVIYEDSVKAEKPVVVNAKEYDDLSKEGAKEPPTKPPPDGKTYAWKVALEVTRWSNGGIILAPGDVAEQGDTIFVRLANVLCQLDTKSYVLDSDKLTLTPDPMGFTLHEGIIEVGRLKDWRARMLRRALLTMALSLTLMSTAHGAITSVGTASSGGTGATAATSSTFAHNSGSTGSNRLLICGVSKRALTDISGITYNGDALTFLDRNEANANGVELWYLLTPDTGSNNVVTTAAAGIAMVTGCQTYAGVDQSVPFGTVATVDGSSSATSAPLDVTGVAGDLVFSVLGRRDQTDTVTTDAGQTQLWQTSTSDTANNIGVGSQEAAVGTTTTVTYTWSNGHIYAHSAVAMKPAPDTRKSRDIVLGY